MAAEQTEETYEFYAGMTCGGCKGAVERILGKFDTISSFTADVETKKVLVTGTMDPQKVLKKLSKWGKASDKEVRLVGKVEASE